MKKTFLRILPLMAAVLLASSCGKDDDNSVNPVVNNNETEQHPTETVAENEYVTIPFSVGIAANEGLSKITCESYTDKEGHKKVKRSFGVEDVGKELTVTGDDIEESTLTYKNVGTESEPSYKFTGSIKVKSNKVSDFTDGNVKMRGVLGTPLKELSTSTVSLDDAMTKFAYEVCEEFYSNESEDIQLTDQNAYLAIGLPVTETSVMINDVNCSLNLGRCWIAFDPASTEITSDALGLSEKDAIAGTVYTVYRKAFSVSDTKKVHFSIGNLQYNVSTGKWRFAGNQYDYIGGSEEGMGGNVEGSVNTNLNGPWIDLFGWVGASASITGAPHQYGVTTNTSNSDYGFVPSDALKSDWCNVPGIGTGWSTLTTGSDGEWKYLLASRTTKSNVRYAKACVNGVNGLIIVPDDWNTETYNLQRTNESTDVNYSTNTIDLQTWENTLESAGAVFLPAAGFRDGTVVKNAGSGGNYWSSSASTDSGIQALGVNFSAKYTMNVKGSSYRRYGASVRLVRAL